MSSIIEPGEGVNSGNNNYFAPNKGSAEDFYQGAFNDKVIVA